MDESNEDILIKKLHRSRIKLLLLHDNLLQKQNKQLHPRFLHYLSHLHLLPRLPVLVHGLKLRGLHKLGHPENAQRVLGNLE